MGLFDKSDLTFDAPGRGRVYNNIIETIGNTPLVRLNRVAADAGNRDVIDEIAIVSNEDAIATEKNWPRRKALPAAFHPARRPLPPCALRRRTACSARWLSPCSPISPFDGIDV